jgi:hypothetical protein
MKHPATQHTNTYISTIFAQLLQGKVRELLVPKIPDPWLPKLPTALPVPVKIPFVTSNFVAPAAASAPLPVPDAAPPAEPNKLVDIAEPLPEFVALPPLVPTPEPIVADIPFRVPVVVLPMLRAPLLLPKPPVGPVETGVTVVVKVEGAKAVLVPPLFLPLFLFVVVMAAPGTSVVTVLKFTGLRPAPKPPVPEEVVVPPKVRVPSPPSVMPTFPACEPVVPPAAFPVAVPNVVSMKPDPPLVVVNSPLPVPSATPTIPVTVEVCADPLPLASPSLVADPEMIPPVNCNFLDPLRLLRVGV